MVSICRWKYLSGYFAKSVESYIWCGSYTHIYSGLWIVLLFHGWFFFFFFHFNCISFMHSCFSIFYQNCQELFSSPFNHFYMELLNEPSPGHKKILSFCNILIVQFVWSNNLTGICSLQSLLCDPNPNSPANSEAARMFSENKREYNRRVREIVEQSWTAD